MADKYVTATCPHCGGKIDYLENATVATCYFCDRNILVSELKGNSGAASSQMNYAQNAAQLIDTSESAHAYLENYFDLLDWSEYQSVSDVAIEEIERVVEKNKIKNAVNPLTWSLEFISINTPLNKKIDGLALLENELKEKYNSADNTESFETYDAYMRVNNHLVASREQLIKKLQFDIKYFEKFNGDTATASQMKREVEKTTKRLNELKTISEIDEIPAIIQLKKEKDAKYETEAASRGINAEMVYGEAINALSFSDDASRALELFIKVRGYKDSEKYIERLNKYYSFNGELYNITGNRYTTATDKEETTQEQNTQSKKTKIDVKKLTPTNYSFTPVGPKTFSLYPVENLVAASKPVIKNMTKIVTSFGNSVFYIKKGKELCAYDLKKHVESVLYSTKVGYFYTDKNRKENPWFAFTTDKNSFFMKVKLDLTKVEKKKGCIQSIKDSFKKPVQEEKELNNYTIIKIDMINVSCETIIEKTVDIYDWYDDKIFYTVAKKVNDEVENTFFMHDIVKNYTKKVLDNQCDIHNVCNGKVIYSTWDPTQYNMNLHVLDIETNITTLVEKNIYDYFSTINGRVYYTVGNAQYCPLFSNNLEGSDRVEIMQNVQKIVAVKHNWMYVLKGLHPFISLFKVSVDGKKYHHICSRLSSIVKMTNGYIYYIDTANRLHIVRNDGKNDKIIADGLSEGNNLIIDKDAIYYVRKEIVSSSGSKTTYSNSLYRMDLDGHNVKKLAFDVKQVSNFDDSTIYILRNVTRTYEVTTPISAKETKTSYETYNLKIYSAFNKVTEDFEELLVLGLPTAEEKEFKPGCFKKPKKIKVTYKEVPLKIKYVRTDVAKAGATSAEADKESAALAAVNGTNNNQGCGNYLNQTQNKSNNQGCANSLTKK